MKERGDLVTTSSQSKADYIIYSLMKGSVGTEHTVSAVIIETKHLSELDSSAIPSPVT